MLRGIAWHNKTILSTVVSGNTRDSTRPGGTMNLHPIILVLGPTAVGKRSILEHALEHKPRLKVIPTFTTRAPREEEKKESLWYKFVSRKVAKRLIESGQAINWIEDDGDCYGQAKDDIDHVLRNYLGVLIVSEAAIVNFRRAHYRVVTVNVTAEGQPELTRDRTPCEEKGLRQGSVRYDHNIINVFDPQEPGAHFECAVQEFCSIVRKNIMRHSLPS